MPTPPQIGRSGDDRPEALPIEELTGPHLQDPGWVFNRHEMRYEYRDIHWETQAWVAAEVAWTCPTRRLHELARRR
jgi:hypothetical protein